MGSKCYVTGVDDAILKTTKEITPMMEDFDDEDNEIFMKTAPRRGY